MDFGPIRETIGAASDSLMHDLIEFFCDLDELGAWILSKTILAAWYWWFPKKAGGKDPKLVP